MWELRNIVVEKLEQDLDGDNVEELVEDIERDLNVIDTSLVFQISTSFDGPALAWDVSNESNTLEIIDSNYDSLKTQEQILKGYELGKALHHVGMTAQHNLSDTHGFLVYEAPGEEFVDFKPEIDAVNFLHSATNFVPGRLERNQALNYLESIDENLAEEAEEDLLGKVHLYGLPSNLLKSDRDEIGLEFDDEVLFYLSRYADENRVWGNDEPYTAGLHVAYGNAIQRQEDWNWNDNFE